MTKIVNLTKEKCDFKITRRRDNTIADPPDFGFLGNPFFVKEYGREGCIEEFKEYFYERLETDKEFKKAVLDLKGKTLGCFCKPLKCHGDIVVDYIENYKEVE